MRAISKHSRRERGSMLLRLTMVVLPALAMPALVYGQALSGNYGLVAGFSGGNTTSQILAPDGTNNAPSFAFTSAPNTGFYLAGSGNPVIANSGILAAVFSTTGVTLGNLIGLDASRGSVLAISARINTPLNTPASSSATCTTGDWSGDTGFVYLCTATNTWKRVALSTF